MAMHILNCPANFFMNALSNELGTFMMWIVTGKFARHIMNMDRRLPKHLHDVDSKGRCRCIFCYTYS